MKNKSEKLESMEKLKEDYLDIKAPKDGLEHVMKKMDEAEALRMKNKKLRRWKRAGLASAAAVAIMVILPNTSATVAYAMEQIPVIGRVVKVITFRDYAYKDDKHEANVKVPQITEEEGKSSAVNQVNEQVQDYTQQAIAQFEKEAGENKEGHKGLDISYETVTDNEEWFVLKVVTLETEASGFESAKYYTINKKNDTIVSLSDLFKDGTDYVTRISEALKSSMREQMEADENKMYFLDDEDMPDENFQSIGKDQNFYINAQGQLVIAFDEYEVAPGAMGRVEFVITDKAVTDSMK